MIIIKDLIIYNEYKNKILVNINQLIINDAATLIIKGNSGSGKTIFLKTLAYEHRHFAGNIVINEKIFESYTEKEYFKIVQFVNQAYPLFTHLTAYEQLIHVLLYIKKEELIIAKEKVKEKLSLLNLWEHRDKYPAQLSGGQRQRFAILQKTLLNPKYLLLDEPTSGLDNAAKKELLQYLLEEKKMGMTLIISSHDQYTINFFDGKIIYDL
jgi:polar amino acid transport system ATP-binding protein